MVSPTSTYLPFNLRLSSIAILNITNPQCSAIGEALVPVTNFPPSSDAGATALGPLEAATVSLVFPTGSVQGSVPKFSNLPSCAVSFHSIVKGKNESTDNTYSNFVPQTPRPSMEVT